jgi:hypothetical protein
MFSSWLVPGARTQPGGVTRAPAIAVALLLLDWARNPSRARRSGPALRSTNALANGLRILAGGATGGAPRGKRG